MPATIVHYNYFKKFIVDGSNIDWNTDTIKVALCDSSYTPDIDTHDYLDDITNELSGGGYARGTLTNTTTLQASSDNVKLDANDISFAALTATNVRYAIIYKEVAGGDANCPLIGYVNFGENITITNGTLAIAWHANGVTVIA